MFTGIVQATCLLKRVDTKAGLLSIQIELPEQLCGNVNLGASIAIDGVCLTVTAFEKSTGLASFDIIQQTLEVSSLHQLQENTAVNIERSATMHTEIGGHQVSGHIDARAEIVAIEDTANNRRVTYQYPAALDKYLFEKGFVALNGCSLTIADIDHERCQLTVSYIPETLKVTTHGEKVVGSLINIEIDRQTQAIVDTVERHMARLPAS